MDRDVNKETDTNQSVNKTIQKENEDAKKAKKARQEDKEDTTRGSLLRLLVSVARGLAVGRSCKGGEGRAVFRRYVR